MATSEQEEISDFEQEFNAATKHLPSILSNVASPDLLYFYARYKQAKLWNQVPSLEHFEVQNSGDFLYWKYKEIVLFLTEEIQYHESLWSRELGQAPILLCGPNS